MMTATYSPEDNKLRLSSVGRLDPETYARVRAAGFIWAPKQEIFVAPMWTPERADLLLEFCEEIDDEDTSLVDRAEERAERFEGYEENRAADAEQAHQAVARIADNIPLGQPILVGHHSERHARKDAQRIENGMRRAVKMWETSKYWKSRAAGAIRHAKYKQRPDVRARRIKGLESDLRKQEKQIKVSEGFTKAWSTEGLTLPQVTHIANYDHRVSGIHGYSLWSDLKDGKATPAEAAAHALARHERHIADARRWIAHITNRLTYERAMLAETGWTPPAKKTKAVLPLLNYSGEIAYRNMYRDEEIVRTQAVGLTKAELAAIHNDYKGTRVSACGTHRVRTAMISNGGASRVLAAVYLTDSKQHERPSPEAVQAEVEEQEIEERLAAKLKATQDRARAPRPAPDTRGATFEAMRESLRSGVKVVTAPQLFPTPAHIADRMVELAQLDDGDKVLEPSAGTGALIDAIGRSGRDVGVIAVETNLQLAEALRRRDDEPKVYCADFLCCASLPSFKRILMNPPFERGSDIEHILYAKAKLRSGGRLVAICANGPRQQEALKPLAATWEELPAGTFAGTGVRAVLLTIEN